MHRFASWLTELAQGGCVVTVTSRVFAQARAGSDHGYDAVLGVLAGRDFVKTYLTDPGQRSMHQPTELWPALEPVCGLL